MILIELRMCDRMKKKNGQMSDELKQRRDIMERKKKIIVAVAAVLVLMVGLMAWKKSETKLSGRYKTDQSTQYIYMLPEANAYIYCVCVLSCGSFISCWFSKCVIFEFRFYNQYHSVCRYDF